MLSEKSLAIIGWAMYYKGYTKEQLENLDGFHVILLMDEYEEEREKEIENLSRKE